MTKRKGTPAKKARKARLEARLNNPNHRPSQVLIKTAQCLWTKTRADSIETDRITTHDLEDM